MKMGTDGQAEKDKGEIVPGKSQSEQCPNEEEEVESKADRRTVGLRCFQGNRETSEDEPSELGAAVVTSSESVFLVPPLISQPQYLDCDFDVALTAEVKVENGACLALLTSVTPNLGYQKPGSFLNGNFHFPPSLRKKRISIDSFLPSGSFSGCYSSVIQAWGQMRPASSLTNSDGVIEMAKSPLPSSPSNSPSSPSSAPSSPSSSPSSSSPGGMGTNYREDEDRGHAGGSRVSKGTGDFVSSTSSSLVPSSMPVPPSSNPSLHPSSSFTHPCNDGQRESLENDIYDPFHPTEGEGERDRASTEDEEEEVDKYDPFEPTGSPASETEEEKRCMDEENEEGSSINSEGNVAKADKALEMGTPAGTEGGPPDSTEIDAPSSMFNNVPLELNSKRTIKDRIREQGKNQRERGTDSEHSEIEEGEIVGANERGRERVIERRREVLLPSSSSPSYLQAGVPKPERILRVLDGDGFVSVRADEEWEREPVASVGVGDLRRKLTSRRKERFRSCPSSASISPPPVPVLPLPSPSFTNSPPLSTDKGRSRKSSKSSKDRDRHKRKEGRGDKKKRKEEKESGEGKRESKERDHEKRSVKENKDKDRDRGRSSQSDSHKRKKRRRSTPEHSSLSHSQNASRHTHSRRSWSSHSEDRHKDRDQDKEREREQERNHERDRDRDRWRDDRDRERDRDSRRRDEQRRDRDEDIRKSSSRERGSTKRSRGSSDRRDREKEMVGERDRDRDRRRDIRPVVPPSIQDLNGSDLFAIKRTITITTTTTTTTVPGSPPHSRCSRSPSQSSDKHRKRKKKRRRQSDDKERKDEEHRSRSSPTSLTPPRYHGYESDRLSDRPEIDMLSLDGEALDSDYPSLEDSPLLPPPPEPPLPSPKIKSGAPKTSQHHLKKKSRSSKTVGQSESTSSSSSHRPKAKSQNLLSSLSPPLSASSGNTTSLQPTASSSTTKRGRKTGKEKIGKKDAGRSGRSKKLSGTRKGKLQSKVSVLVREGVSSTTGNSGKLGLDLLGPGGVVSGASGPSVVGGSIAVVFRRDNESRSPFLKPCSETLALPGRGKDPSKTGKQHNILGPLSSTNPSGLKSKKAKPSSATSTSSSASSPTSSLAAKRRRRPGKKPREKGINVDGSDSKGVNSNCSTVGGGWPGVATEMQPLVGVGSKPSSPPSALPGPTPSSSSSSSTSSSASILPPSSSPPHTSPLSLPPSRDTRESSPDSQTVDSSCKTPEPSFLSEEGPGQSKALSLTPSKSPASPPGLLSSQIRGDTISQSTSSAKPLPPDDQKGSPPCSTSTALVAASISHSSAPLANDPSLSSSSSVSSSSINKPPPPPPPPLPWSLQTGVDCTAGGVLALTALLFKMEEANIASRAKAQEFIQATSQILSQANQNQSQPHPPLSSSSVSSQVPPPPSHAPPPGPTPAQFILHSSVPLVGCTKTPPSHLHPGLSMGGGCAQTPPPPLPVGMTGPTGGSETGWDNESKDPDKYLKKLHTQERAVEEVKLAIKPYYQRKDINKDEYKDILRKAVHKICHSRTGEINPVKVSNLVKLYVQRYKYFRKHGRKMDEEEKEDRESASMHSST
ncbi:splicing factor, arginine/serine-rich 19-like isoform X1 [Sinocyclocheilus anshuiensis]|uniref:splicing factor, arginine/serine-rich 19-like isoform X1 n=2 Tax=Sinocyclocheilus anshuiensis TaxID=1608454 RepID=UPI0007B89C97|nr:PREDICTED: splicing factor, arginine/serine-rich 19-like isoform X1 [Sinocyclocheilus anshuiensis]